MAAEMALFVRASRAKLARCVRRADMMPYMTSTTVIFDQASWQTFRDTPQPEWVSKPAQGRAAHRRRGPSREQEAMYEAIRSRTLKRPRSNVYRSV